MGSHDRITDLLDSYADRALDASQRTAVEAHLSTCHDCELELGGVRRLNTMLASFPPAPPVPFHSFWARLQMALPKPALGRQSGFAPGRRLALVLVAAAVSALMVGISAFASEGALPDNPFFAVKQLREAAQITMTADPQARARLEIQFAADRLREALAMSGRDKPELTVASLKRFDDLVNALQPALKQPANDRQREAMKNAIKALRHQLDAVEDINEARGDDLNVSASLQTARSLLPADEPEDQPVVEIKQESQDNPVTQASPAPVVTQTPQPPEVEQPETHDSGSHH